MFARSGQSTLEMFQQETSLSRFDLRESFQCSVIAILWSIVCSRLPDIIVKEFVQFGPNTPYGQEFNHKNSKSMSQPNFHFLCTVLPNSNITLWVLHKPPINATDGNYDVFVYFSCRLELYDPRLAKGMRLVFELMKCFRHTILPVWGKPWWPYEIHLSHLVTKYVFCIRWIKNAMSTVARKLIATKRQTLTHNSASVICLDNAYDNSNSCSLLLAHPQNCLLLL